VARFLSPEWFDDVEAASCTPEAASTPKGASTPDGAEAPGGEAPAPVMVLQQVVTATPDGDVTYHVVIAPDATVELRRGPAPRPDLALTSDYPTAVAIATGELSAQTALVEGWVRIGGDLSRLAEHHLSLAGVDPLPPAVRRTTTF